MSNKTAAKIAVREALIHLVEVNQAFKKALLSDSHLPLWIMKEGTLSTGDDLVHDRTVAAEVSTRLTYLPDQSKQETARLTGLVGISPATFDIGISLNESRKAFKAAMNDYRHLFGDSIDTIEQTSEELRENLLGGLKIKHIHFIQCYRQLKLFHRPPKRVGFSWASTHSGSVRLSASDAIEHLKSKYLASGAIGSDIKTLQRIPADEVIIIKRVLAPHLRANLTWPKMINEQRAADSLNRKLYPNQINTPLPIFITLKPGEHLPDHNQIRPFNPFTKQERLQRSDARLEKINQNPYSRIYRHVFPETEH